MNTEFSYMYRDGSNYKSHGTVIFAGTLSAEIKEKLMDDEDGFIAHSVRVPEVFLYQQGYRYDEETDHCYHEVSGVENTTDDPDDEFGRTAEQFAQEFLEKKGEGVFDPLERWPDMEIYQPGTDGESLDICITEGTPCNQ